MKIDDFKNELTKLNIDYNDEMLDKLNTYFEYLNEYNSHTNLTTITNKEDVYLKHFYDSLTLVKAIDLKNVDKMLDIGSGAGFPGIVIKIFFPNINLTVLDSNNKKTTFISSLVEKLNLSKVNVINARAEDYLKNHENSFDLVTSRAVAYIDIILSLSIPFAGYDGKVVLMKGNFEEEEELLKKYQQELHVKDYKIKNFNIADNQERNLVIIERDKLPIKILNYSQIKKRHDKWNVCK